MGIILKFLEELLKKLVPDEYEKYIPVLEQTVEESIEEYQDDHKFTPAEIAKVLGHSLLALSKLLPGSELED